MGFKINPVAGEKFISATGKQFKWDDTTRVWRKAEVSLVPDVTGTNDKPLSKVWTGTYAEYSALPKYFDDIAYFIKD